MFEKLVDRLLYSPRYGEKWGRHWMDVARYSDSNGMDDNIAYTEAWRYRDYVISAFNRDKPYDQFVREQIAGDLISSWGRPDRAESVVATTFLMLGPKMPSADDPIKQQLDIVDEQLDTVSRAFLPMVINSTHFPAAIITHWLESSKVPDRCSGIVWIRISI